MTQGPARLPVLPRDLAASIIVSAIARGAWAIAGCVLFLTLVSAPNLLGGDARESLVPVAAMLAMLGMIVIIYLRPARWSLLLYLVGGAVCVYLFQLAILSAEPGIQAEAVYALNRPALALVLVGTVSPRPLDAVRWGIAGFVLGTGASILVCLQLGLPVLLGFGPSIALVDYCACFLAVALIQRTQRGRVPDLDRLQVESRMLGDQLTADQRTAALIHDTVLNDLAVVLSGPPTLDERSRDRLRADVDALLRGLEQPRAGATSIPTEAAFRHAVMAVASDFQWRGLNVDVTADSDEVVPVSSATAIAAIGAIRACLENVLQHSGTTSAELILGHSESALTIMVVDSGVGFDPEAVAADRLGLRASVVHRVESDGGTARVWSTPGFGTSVMITIPLTLPAPVIDA